MKFKTTRKQMQNNYSKVINVGYCTLQNLLNYESPMAYSCGVDGWNGDYYEVDNVLIATGYRGLPATTCDNYSYDLAREYDDKAQGKSREERTELLKEFINKVR